MCHKKLADCFIEEKLKEVKSRIEKTMEDVVLVIGVGVRLITR